MGRVTGLWGREGEEFMGSEGESGGRRSLWGKKGRGRAGGLSGEWRRGGRRQGVSRGKKRRMERM